MDPDSSLFKSLVYWAANMKAADLYRNFDIVETIYRRTPWIQSVARERAVLRAEISTREAKYLSHLEGTL